jgi:hypothetical protein
MNTLPTQKQYENKPKKRKWVRFDFSPQITFSLLLPENSGSDPQKDLIQKAEHRAEMLELQKDGALIATDLSLEGGSFVSLNLSLESGMLLKGILGKVKRTEKENQDQILMGIEFCSKEDLPSFYGESSEVRSLESKLKEIILDYILKKKREKQKAKSKC